MISTQLPRIGKIGKQGAASPQGAAAIDGALWNVAATAEHQSGQQTGAGAPFEVLPVDRMAADLLAVDVAHHPRLTVLRQEPNRPFVVRAGKRLRGLFDRLIASSSLISNDPVLNVRDFTWTNLLRDHWRTIREEAVAVAMQDWASPPLAQVSPDHRAIAHPDTWRSFFLRGYGFDVAENIELCPNTAALVRQVPGLNSAFFSILEPGAHIPAHRGVTKGLITTHLGLVVPRDGDARMRIGDRVLRWAEGETVVFDDTYSHEVWNESAGRRVVLTLQTSRPLRLPGRLVADWFLNVARRSAFVQETLRNVHRWNAAIRQQRPEALGSDEDPSTA